jgi:ribosomal protein S18 acetylase RimI-like enzyme
MPQPTSHIRYSTSPADITPQMLHGFFEGWRHPLTPDQHLRLLQQSTHCILAIDQDTGQVVGFINALTDGILSAFIPLLEVLPAYRHQGIGTQLLQRLLATLAHYPNIDLTCDPDLQPFYQRHGFIPSTAMIRRPVS